MNAELRIFYHMLRSFILDGNSHPRWDMSYSNSTIGGICMLTTRTSRSISINPQVFIPQPDINLKDPRTEEC